MNWVPGFRAVSAVESIARRQSRRLLLVNPSCSTESFSINIASQASPRRVVRSRVIQDQHLVTAALRTGNTMSADSIVLSRSMRSNSTATASDACHDRSLRFLNLPPELRIFVYTELLPLRQKPAENQTQATRKHCYPEIRRACHLVHKEALDVLFSTEIQLSMALVVCESEAATRAICKHPRPHSICGSVNGLPLNIDKTTKLFTSPSRVWPAIISNIPKLRLLIDMCTPRTIWLDNSLISSRENEYSWQLNHLLYDLSNFLEWGWPSADVDD